MNSPINSIIPWLEHLKVLMPSSHITLVGAGNGHGSWARWLSALNMASTLVEADAQQFAALQRQQAAGNFAQARLLHAVVAAQAGEVAFHTNSLAEESGLLPAETVQPLWPNVHTLQTQQRPATALTALLEQQHANQWLVLDCLPAATLLQASASAQARLDVVVARVVLTENKAYQIPGAGLAELADLLPDFVQLALQPSRHPEFAHVLLVRDYRSVVQQVQADLQAQLAKIDAEKVELLQKIELYAQSQKALQADLSKAIQSMDTGQFVHALQPMSQGIEALAQELKKQNADLLRVRKQLENTVKHEVLNATQQLEAFLNIQSFFTHGEHQPIMHGWPVSPDFALYLIGLLEKNDYDLILEFGSGTSTVIMAKAFARLNNGRSRSRVVQIAFEHLEQYHAQTLADLQAAGMAEAVEVVLAPLQPYRAPNGTTYPYYACQEKLADLAGSQQAPNRKILVVVDGPPSSTGKNARYPALPVILAQFKNNSIDFLLEDYFREDEKEIANLWIKDCEIAGFTFKTDSIKMEKDAFFISIQPQ